MRQVFDLPRQRLGSDRAPSRGPPLCLWGGDKGGFPARSQSSGQLRPHCACHSRVLDGRPAHPRGQGSRPALPKCAGRPSPRVGWRVSRPRRLTGLAPFLAELRRQLVAARRPARRRDGLSHIGRPLLVPRRLHKPSDSARLPRAARCRSVRRHGRAAFFQRRPRLRWLEALLVGGRGRARSLLRPFAAGPGVPQRILWPTGAGPTIWPTCWWRQKTPSKKLLVERRRPERRQTEGVPVALHRDIGPRFRRGAGPAPAGQRSIATPTTCCADCVTTATRCSATGPTRR